MEALTARKLKRRLLDLDPDLTVEVRDVRVNGNCLGCSGFVTNTAGSIVYVNTDHNHGTEGDRALYRTAQGTRDFTGGVNRTSNYDLPPQAVIDLLG